MAIKIARRKFIAVALGGATFAWPFAARSQQPAKVARIGYLGFGPASAFAIWVEALRAGLRDLGYVEGKNIVIEFRWAERADQLPELAAELVRMNVDIIFAASSTLVEPARQATKTIPIVFANHADPVGVGHVASLARPGGNITGMSMLLTERPRSWNPERSRTAGDADWRSLGCHDTLPPNRPASGGGLWRKSRVRLVVVPVRTVDDFEGAFQTMSRERVAGILVLASPLTYSQRALLAELALKHQLPGMFGTKENVEAGGLMSYSADIVDLYRRSAIYIDKILKGAKPADLPVEQASKYELVINLATAKSIGFAIPERFLVRADKVIE